MIKYVSVKQLSIEEFETPFENSLSEGNRWVQLSKIVPWDDFASAYISMMNADSGRPGICPRIVLGALIIKHKENLDDRGVIAAIQENIYMQYFIGLKGFQIEPVFDASLFVEIRKRIGADTFDDLNAKLLKSISGEKDKKHTSKKGDDDENSLPKNKGKLQMDATVADQCIAFPTDSNILNECRVKSEKMIDQLYDLNGKKDTKPRTYRRVMATSFLNYSKSNSHE
jgi:hypothetical protein